MSRVTFADLCPSIRCSARTLTPARLAAVCRKSCGVIAWTFDRFTAPANHPRVDYGRGRYFPSGPPNTSAPGSLSLHSGDSWSRTNDGTGTERSRRPLVWPTAWSTPSCTALSETTRRRFRNSTSRTRSAIASPHRSPQNAKVYPAAGAPPPRQRAGARQRPTGRCAGGWFCVADRRYLEPG